MSHVAHTCIHSFTCKRVHTQIHTYTHVHTQIHPYTHITSNLGRDSSHSLLINAYEERKRAVYKCTHTCISIYMFYTHYLYTNVNMHISLYICSTHITSNEFAVTRVTVCRGVGVPGLLSNSPTPLPLFFLKSAQKAILSKWLCA